MHDNEDICLKCGGWNELSNVQFVNHLLCECDTKCKICGYEDFWAYGFYMSGCETSDIQKEFSDE